MSLNGNVNEIIVNGNVNGKCVHNLQGNSSLYGGKENGIGVESRVESNINAFKY